MAVYKIFPEKDATIYSEYPSMNTGIDEILEVNTLTGGDPVGGTPEVSRTLIKFPTSEITSVLENKVTGTFKTNLNLYSAKVTGLSQETAVECYPVSGAWENGTGKYLDSPQTTNGVSWTWTNNSGSNSWATSNFGTYATASYSGSNQGGGTWYTGSSLGLSVVQSASFSYRSDLDLNLNVTDTILTWYSGGLSNDGFIIKQAESLEFLDNKAYRTELKYFSVDTNTIYPPSLDFKWDDSSYSVGSLITVTSQDTVVTLKNRPITYNSESIQRFRLNVRPQNPTRTFTTSSVYTTNYALPQNTYYAIKDLDTDEYVIDFDTNYTKVSCDSSGNYFDVYMNGLQPERYYTVLLKTTLDGSTTVFTENLSFKVGL